MLEERNKAVSRSLYSNRLSYSGPPLDMKNLSQATFHSSVHRISQRLDSELDNNVNCVNYPNGDFQTFRGYGLISRENLVTIFQLLPTDILVTAKSWSHSTIFFTGYWTFVLSGNVIFISSIKSFWMFMISCLSGLQLIIALLQVGGLCRICFCTVHDIFKSWVYFLDFIMVQHPIWIWE